MKIQVIVYGLEELKEKIGKEMESASKRRSLLGICLIVAATMVALTDYNAIYLLVFGVVALIYGFTLWSAGKLKRELCEIEEVEHGVEICSSDCIYMDESDTVTLGTEWKYSLVLHEDMEDGTVNVGFCSKEVVMNSNTAQELRSR